MKKTIIIITSLLFMFSCTKEHFKPSHSSLNKEAISISQDKHIYVEEDTTVDYTTTIFDSCANEYITLSGLETFLIKKSFQGDDDFYYIYYEIDLSHMTGVGQTSGTFYHGGGRVIGSNKVANRKTTGKISYNVSYKSNRDIITFNQRATYMDVNGRVLVDFNSGFIESCK